MSIKKRYYKNYESYVAHQKEKMERPWYLLKRQKAFDQRVNHFRRRLNYFDDYFNKDDSILCVAARLGDEVKALRKLGYKNTIGVDLYPGPDNKLVEKGDFHNLPYSDSSYDILYSNSLDHVYDFEKFSKEMFRILKPEGYFVVESEYFVEKTDVKTHLNNDKKYESVMWDSVSDLIDALRGFRLEKEFYTIDKKAPKSWVDKYMVLLLKKS